MFIRGLVFFLLLVSAVQAEPWSVYLNNKPFKGSTSGGPDSLLVEAAVLARSTSLRLEFKDGTLMLGAEQVPTILSSGKVMVAVKPLAERPGGRYVVNPDLGTVDIYLLSDSAGTGG